MKKYQPGIILRLILLASLMSMLGCAQQMKSVQAEAPQEVSVNGEIKGIVLSEDASSVDITSDLPIVYTYYLQDSPPGIVIDLAQVTPGTLQFPMEINRGSVKRIDVTRHEFGSGVLSRVAISLNSKVDVSAFLDPKDKSRLALKLVTAGGDRPAEAKGAEKVPSVPVQGSAAVEPLQAKDTATVQEKQTVIEPAVEKPVAEVKPAAVQAGAVEASGIKSATEGKAAAATDDKTEKTVKGEKVGGPVSLKAIRKSDDGILLVISGEIGTYKAFKLSDPERLVVDIAKTRNDIATKTVDVNGFNLGKARFGGSSDKLRVVFDAAGGSIPFHAVSKNEYGLLISFGEAARKAAAAKSREVEAKTVEPDLKSSAPVPAAAPTSPPEPVATPVTVATASVTPEAEAKPAATPLKAALDSSPGDGRSKAPATQQAPAKPSTSASPAKVTTKGGAIDSIEFAQTDGLSRITMKTAGGCTVSEPVKSAKGLYVSLKGCRLPAKLQRQLDTSGFESVIREVVPYPVKKKGLPEARVAVNLRKMVPNIVKREGGVFTWEFSEPVKPVKLSKPVKTLKPDLSAEKPVTDVAAKTEDIEREMADTRVQGQKARSEKGLEDAFAADKLAQQAARQGKQYTGRKVSLEFSDADIRKIFQLIAEVSNQNFLISDDVTGTISLKLINVPWDQALDVILENKGLGMQKSGNIVQIRPRTKMKSLDDEAIEMRLTEEKKMPLSTVIFDINFATLSDIETQFRALKSKRPDTSISSDIRTNKIIVVDIDPNIKKMRSLLESLDVPEKQVMIEARIVEASSTFARDIGVKWNFGYQDGSASIANINNLATSMGGVVTNVLPTGTTGGIAAGMSFGKLISNIQLDMRLSAASSVGQVKIISTPKVLTVNNKAAKISQGQMIPYQNTSSSEGAKTEFIEAALSLEVTPHITADGSVNMKIKASNNSVGTGSPPPINKKEATTELVVKNGETTVIGGIYVDSETEGDTGVPFLSDIPLLGWLFKSNAKNKTKNELLIFITPKIVG